MCQAVTWVISLDKTLSLVLPLSSWMSLGKLQYLFLFLHVYKMHLIPICLPHRIEISTRDNPREIIWENCKGLHSSNMSGRVNELLFTGQSPFLQFADLPPLYFLTWKVSDLDVHLDFFPQKYRSNMLHFQLNILFSNSI